jgi:hypothetical protein
MPYGLDRRAASTLVRLAVFAVAGIAAPGIQPSRLAAAVPPVRELVGEDHRVGKEDIQTLLHKPLTIGALAVAEIGRTSPAGGCGCRRA